MRIQLAYWATDGTAVYSKPAESGEVCLNLDKAPNNSGRTWGRRQQIAHGFSELKALLP